MADLLDRPLVAKSRKLTTARHIVEKQILSFITTNLRNV